MSFFKNENTNEKLNQEKPDLKLSFQERFKKTQRESKSLLYQKQPALRCQSKEESKFSFEPKADLFVQRKQPKVSFQQKLPKVSFQPKKISFQQKQPKLSFQPKQPKLRF